MVSGGPFLVSVKNESKSKIFIFHECSKNR